MVTPSTMAATSSPELGLDLLDGDARVLDRVVEQRRGDGDVVEAEVGEDQGDPERVRDVGLARAPDLLGVGDAGQLEGLLDQPGVGAPVALPVGRDEGRDLDVDGVVAPPGQHRTAVGADLDARFRGAHRSDQSYRRLADDSCLPGSAPSVYRRFFRRCCRGRGFAAPRLGGRRGRSGWSSTPGVGVGADVAAAHGSVAGTSSTSSAVSSVDVVDLVDATAAGAATAVLARRPRRRRRDGWRDAARGRPRHGRATRGSAARAP